MNLERLAEIKAPFRREPGTNEVIEGYDHWKARQAIFAAMQRIIDLAMDSMEQLDWAQLAPEKSEEEADEPLRKLHAEVRAFFGEEA